MKRYGLIAVALLAACTSATKKEAPKIALHWQAQLDSGNAAYRRGDYKASSQFFHAAAQARPDDITGWYGVYMAESKLGNTKEAAYAKGIVAKAAPDLSLGAHDAPGKTETGNPHAAPTADPHAGLELKK